MNAHVLHALHAEAVHCEWLTLLGIDVQHIGLRHDASLKLGADKPLKRQDQARYWYYRRRLTPCCGFKQTFAMVA